MDLSLIRCAVPRLWIAMHNSVGFDCLPRVALVGTALKVRIARSSAGRRLGFVLIFGQRKGVCCSIRSSIQSRSPVLIRPSFSDRLLFLDGSRAHTAAPILARTSFAAQSPFMVAHSCISYVHFKNISAWTLLPMRHIVWHPSSRASLMKCTPKFHINALPKC
jgi:hypothetical protein